MWFQSTFCNFVVLLQNVDEIVSIFVTSILDPKITNYQAEVDWVGAMAPASSGIVALGAPMLLQTLRR